MNVCKLNKIHLQFPSFLDNYITQIVEIFPRGRQGPFIQHNEWGLLLMSWWRKDLGYQQSWYGLNAPRILEFSIPRVKQWYVCVKRVRFHGKTWNWVVRFQSFCSNAIKIWRLFMKDNNLKRYSHIKNTTGRFMDLSRLNIAFVNNDKRYGISTRSFSNNVMSYNVITWKYFRYYWPIVRRNHIISHMPLLCVFQWLKCACKIR